jgi:outer membrane usher protein
VKGVRAYLNNNEVAKTNRRGDAVVQGLIPYYGNRVAISDVDVPLTHAIAGGERVIAPAVRSGAIVAFPVRRLQLVRGVLVLDGADPAYGEVQLEADGESYVSPLGRTVVFELDNLPSGTWRGEATFASGACVIEVEVPSLDTSIIDIGEVRCVTDAVAPAEVTEDPLEPPADTPPDEALSLPVEDAEDALDESGETARTDEVAPSEDVDDGEELP